MKFKLFFYVPFLYFIHTRIASLSKLISWIIIYVIPTFYILYNFSTLGLFETLFVYLLQATIIYNFYEIGYIQNDCETIKKEINPTLRLTEDELSTYERSKGSIYGIRLIIGFAALAALYYLLSDSTANYFPFFFTSLGILIVYQLYNRVRNQLTLLLHFLLVSIRFLSFPLIFWGASFPEVTYLSLFLIFPVINLIERGSDKKFNMKIFSTLLPDKSQLNTFRVKYYFLASIVIGVFVLFQMLPIWVLYLSLYYFFYRLSIIIMKL